MPSTRSGTTRSIAPEPLDRLTWRSWPLVDSPYSSWLAPVLVAGLAIGVWYLGGGWIMALAAAIGLAITLWSYFLPADYEVAPLGLRRRVLNRARLVPWTAVHAYQLRSTGIVVYQRSDPGVADVLRSIFIPYPPEADELLIALRHYASHAIELPR